MTKKKIIDRSHIDTEQRNPKTLALHQLNTLECLKVMQQEDLQVHEALDKAIGEINEFIESIRKGFEGDGRLIYIGAGTSGRLGVLDASEAPPTFHVDENKIIGIIAGGDCSLRKSSEGKEDDYNGAKEILETLALCESDAVLGIASGGTTPYVIGALDYVKQCGPKVKTAFMTCSKVVPSPFVDHMIVLETGPEVLTGSTRLKAGTATKMALNMISTTLMVQTGRVYKNYMVDMKASNDKLYDRALRIIEDLTELNREKAIELLESAKLHVKTALVMFNLNLDHDKAIEALKNVKGKLDQLI